MCTIIENNIRLNNNKFEIQLRPENLGKIHITIEITGQNVDINIFDNLLISDIARYSTLKYKYYDHNYKDCRLIALNEINEQYCDCLLYTSPSPRDS